MTIALLPELAQGTARLARELSPEQASAELLDAMLGQTRLLLQIIRDERDALAAELDRKGMDPNVLLERCRLALETLDRTAETLRLLAKFLGGTERRDDIQRQEETAGQMRREFADWQEAASRPFPPIDRERLQKGMDAAARGDFVRVETYEDLFGEPPGE
jgi:hypothetical protein